MVEEAPKVDTPVTEAVTDIPIAEAVTEALGEDGQPLFKPDKKEREMEQRSVK